MGMLRLSDKAYNLIKEYEKKNGKSPRGWYWESETMSEYEKYLESLIKKN